MTTTDSGKISATDGGRKTHGGRYSEEHPEEALPEELTPEEIDNLVLYEKVEGHIAVITFNRPEKLNAMLAPDSFLEFANKIRRAELDDDIKVIVLTGSGDHFCTGVDLRRTPIEAAGMRPGQRLPQSRRMKMASFESPNMINCSKTVIAAVNGTCIAAGFHFMLECDLLIAAEGARLGEPEARIGFAGFSTAWALLALKIGPNRAREMVLFGELRTAEELKEWGLVNSVVPRDKLMDEAMRYARGVAWLATDNLMLGKRSTQFFYQQLGVDSYETWVSIAHPLFTNMVWRDDEFNFMKERNKRGLRGALAEMKKQWNDMGFS